MADDAPPSPRSGGSVQATLQYLARDDRYRREKPYICNFAVPDGVASTNHVFTEKRVTILDARGSGCDLDAQGFTFRHNQTRLSVEDFDDDTTIRAKYYAELDSWLRAAFPQYKEVVFLNFQVRKRSPDFPSVDLRKFQNPQPLLLAHADMTVVDARRRLSLLPDQIAHRYNSCDFDVLNVWRLLRGPSRDWPLALCDYRTLNVESDVMANDSVFVDGPSENLLLQPSDKHQWYFLDHQTPDEVIVFRQASTLVDPCPPFAMHAAFRRSDAADALLRESIEVRVAAIR